MNLQRLSQREVEVLEIIVRNYIVSGSPTGSRVISKLPGYPSAATIRNTMGDLEEKGYITHPHTSAGRIPTDLGYRYYVDKLVKSRKLPRKIQNEIKSQLLKTDPTDLNLVLSTAGEVVSQVTENLGVVLAPTIDEARFRHLHVYEISPGRLVMNLTFDSGFVKSMVVELSTALSKKRLQAATQIINSRYDGLKLSEIISAGKETLSDIEPMELGVVQLFVPSITSMMQSISSQRIILEGESNIVRHPEFFDEKGLEAIIEIINKKEMLLHVFSQDTHRGQVTISIGGEHLNGKFESFSIVKTGYQIGELTGSLAVIGPKRVPYDLLSSTVEYTAQVLGHIFDERQQDNG